MDQLKVAAASVRNLIGQSDASIANMRKWGQLAADKGTQTRAVPVHMICAQLDCFDALFQKR